MLPQCNARNIPMSELKQAAYNPRRDLRPGDAEYEKLKNSILNFGYVEPIIWNERTGNIVGGHQRAKVLQDLGYDEAMCIVVNLTDEQEKALNIALNKITGEWDMPLLTELLKELDDSDFDVSLTGFDADELGEMFGEVNTDELKGDDFDAEETAEKIVVPFTEPGDVWHIGRHRLLCGDSTVRSDIDKLTDGQKMDVCFTDPPYNVNYEGTAGKIQNDNMADDDFLKFLIAAFDMIEYALKPGGGFYICHADSEGLNFRKAVKAARLTLKQCLVWVKNSFVLGRQDYQWQHEPILYGWKDGAAHYFTADRSNSTVIEDLKTADIKKMTKSQLVEAVKKLIDECGNGQTPTTVIRENKPSRNADHPTMKPIRLVARCIQNSSRRGEKVIDLFGGSGSTLVASEQLQRTAYLMELDPRFCDVIVLRYIQTFGNESQVFLERDGKTTPYNELDGFTPEA